MVPLTAEKLQQRLGLKSLQERFRSGDDPVYSFVVPGKDAIATWQELRAVAPQLGYWPLVNGEAKNLDQLMEWRDSSLASKELLEQATGIDVREFFTERAAESNESDAHGDWPSVSAVGPLGDIPGFTLHRRTLKPSEFLPEVTMSLIPVSESWQVASVLNAGGWNEYPGAEEHIAVQRYWNEVYGAELVGMSHDVIEMRPARQPSSREEASRLAWEQFAYCSDIIYQGVGTIEKLAASLLAGSVWYFWWD